MERKVKEMPSIRHCAKLSVAAVRIGKACVSIHPQFFPSLTSGPLSIPPIFFHNSLLSFLLSYMLYFLIIHSTFLSNLHSQRIYNVLSQHCLYFFIFFQITIFPLTMQQSIKHTWECEHAVQCSIKVAWVVVALKTSHVPALIFLQGLWWHCYAFDVWRRKTSKGWNRETKKNCQNQSLFTYNRSLVLSPDQAITAFQRTISQQFCNMLHVFSHPYARCCDMLCFVGSSLKMVKFEPATFNMSQLGDQTCMKSWPNELNISTQHSTALLAQHLTSHSSDAICCVEMLGLFDRCFTS